MVVHSAPYTVEDFDEFVNLPENADRAFEWIAGKVVEVVSNNYASQLGATFVFFIKLHLRDYQIGGFVTGADGGYIVSGERYIPDAAFVSKARQPEPSHEAYNPIAPDLAIEVLSPSNDPFDMRVKVVNYLRAGTVVWVADPENKRVEVYVPDEPPNVLGIGATLDGGAVLPGFTLAVKEIFEE